MYSKRLKKFFTQSLKAATVAGIIAGTTPHMMRAQDAEGSLLGGGYASQDDMKVASTDEAIRHLWRCKGAVDLIYGDTLWSLYYKDGVEGEDYSARVQARLEEYLGDYAAMVSKADGRELTRAQAVKSLAKKLGIPMEEWKRKNTDMSDDVALCLLFAHDYKYAPLMPAGDKNDSTLTFASWYMASAHGVTFQGHRSTEATRNWLAEGQGGEIAAFEYSDTVDTMRAYAKLPEKIRTPMEKGVRKWAKGLSDELHTQYWKNSGKDAKVLDDAGVMRSAKEAFLESKGISAAERLKYFKTDFSIDLAVIGLMEKEVIEDAYFNVPEKGMSYAYRCWAQESSVLRGICRGKMADEPERLDAMCSLDDEATGNVAEVARACIAAGLTLEGVTGEAQEDAAALNGYVERMLKKNSVSRDEAKEYLGSRMAVNMFIVAVAEPAVVAALPGDLQEKMAALRATLPVGKIKRLIVDTPVM